MLRLFTASVLFILGMTTAALAVGTPPPAEVPEPATLGLIALGAGALYASRRKAEK